MTFVYDNIFRVLLLGVSSGGISTLKDRFLSSIPTSLETITITEIIFSRFSKLVIVNEKTYELQIWIPKEIYSIEEKFEEFKNELYRYLENSSGVILMYDITNLKTLDTLVDYIQLIKDNKIDIPVILVGNKVDLEEERDVEIEQAIQFVNQHNLSESIEISVKTGENVDLMFETLTKLMIKNFDPKIWETVTKYIWYDKKGYPHFDGDHVADEDYDIIYNAYHPIRCTYCWMKEHCTYYPNIEDCEVHSWFTSKEYKNAKKEYKTK